MHSTNQAFERYFQTDGEELRKIYSLAGGDNKVPFRKAEEGREFGDTLGTSNQGISDRRTSPKSLKQKGRDASKLAGPTGLEPVTHPIKSTTYEALITH
jgi:hypothetical protein